MIPRSQAGTQRPPPPQRVTSAGSHRPLNRPALPSKLSTVRSASQQENNVAFHLSRTGSQQSAASQSQPLVKQEAVTVKPEIIDLEDDTYSGTEASTTSSKTYQANGYLADGQSPRPWDSTTTIPPPTPPLPPPQKNQFLPLPGRPAFLSEPTRQQTHSPIVPRGRRDPSRRSSGLRAPAIATSLPRGKVADFFPWTGIAGAHSEDVMNETSVKSGNNDKAQNANSPNIAAESNTARPTLWPSLKGKNGLQVLSALFCQVLDKRQQMGRCTAPSTFKPPPRVTLTDTKREAWLKDLANPDVPLRRLSRTIPHGIRGKVLLDHCITKEIPIARAVWLSKCVGANEIRAFKRKGVSGPSALAGEIKWVREWTVCVEQFVEGVIGECGHSGWSRKMNYAIRLATFFFSEHLLDAEHYIDWILTSLETATTERLPVWVLLTQVYWKHMVSQRKRGRRLSEALLAHAHILMRTEYTSIAPLVDRLQQLISILAIAHQGCLVMPKTWKENDVTFEAIASLDRFAQAKDAMRNAEKRNIRILGGMNLVATTHVKQNLVDMLDRVQADGHIPLDLLPSDSSLQNYKLILSVVLEWATSRHREGMARIYLTARILRQWNITGADTDGVILDTLEAATADPSIDDKPLHEVVALLARSGHFSVGKYLQWLISVGALSGIPAVSNDGKLLLELPTEHLQLHVLNLRQTILSRMGYGAQFEVQELETQKSYLSSLIHNASSAPSSSWPPSDDLAQPSTPTGAVKLSITKWLCDGLLVTRDPSAASMLEERVFKGGLQVFCIVRQTLEAFEDFLSLLLCIRAASVSTIDAQYLATIVDTVNMHADIFAAMGVLDELVDRICKRQQDLRRQLPLDKTLLLALSSLVQRVPSGEQYRQIISSDLQYCATQSSAAACSPASDSMVMTAAGVPESDEDINRVLSSGNTMDEHLFTRMFSIIAERGMKTGLQSIARTAGWFSQLRRFDPSSFDQLQQSLINRLKEPSFTIQTFVQVTATLVGSGCMKIDLPFRTLERYISISKEPATQCRFANISLELVLALNPDRSLLDSPELYKFQLEQRMFRERCPEDVFRMLSLTLTGPVCGRIPVDYAVDQRVLSFVRSQVCKCKYDNLVGSGGGIQAQRLFDRLMSPNGPGCEVTMTPIMRIQRILASANEISLQFCKLALKQCFLSASLNDDENQSLLQVFQEAIEHDRPVWAALLTALDQQLIYQIHTWARGRAIALMSDFVSSAESTVKIDDIRRYMTAADIASSPAEAQAGQPQTISLIHEHLASLGKLVDIINPLDVAEATQRRRIGFGLDMLLQLTARHFQSSADTFASSASEIVTLMCTLCLLLIHQKLQNQRGVLEYILDVTSVIVDDLSPDAISTIVRNLPPFARNDPRIRYLFGITFSPDSWLALASKVYNQPTTAPGTQQTQVPAPTTLPRPSHPLPPRPGSVPQRPLSVGGNSQPTMPQRAPQPTPGQRGNYEIKYNPFQIRRWEIMPDPTPNMGANDTSLSLGLFQARRVS